MSIGFAGSMKDVDADQGQPNYVQGDVFLSSLFYF